MNCDRVHLLLDGYIDGELDPANTLEFEDHLQGCPDCSLMVEQRRALQTAILSNKDGLIWPTPPGLQNKIRASIRKTDRTLPAVFSFPWRFWAAGVAMALLLLGIGFAIRGWVPAGGDNTTLADEIQSAHVRSLMADHLMDIPSTDQHTVKPWFNGKLDFSPPVVDLATQGFPLAGGRLDYLENHPVAALVYMRNKHIINLFVWPAAGTTPGLQNTSANGFNMFHWNQSGMDFWAVSDLNTAELQSFVDLLQKNIS